eukprot:Skav200658  [mRNA]  locus=scaffold3198:30077:30331:- [translate_table: standard]
MLSRLSLVAPLQFLTAHGSWISAPQESWNTIQVCEGKKEADINEDDVNGWITLGFALGGVGFDLMCLLEFYKSNKTPCAYGSMC